MPPPVVLKPSRLTLLPSSVVARLLASLWLCFCLAVLVFGYGQQDIHDMPVAFTWLMLLLSFPLGLLGVGLDYLIVEPVASALSLPYHPFFSLLPSWFAMTIAGYFQWFKILPKSVSWLCRALRNRPT